MKRFQTITSVEVLLVLAKFSLTLVQIQPLPVAHHAPGPEQTAARAADGAEDLAYVLHTSGTTGLPKIVRVPHKCILPNILHLRYVRTRCFHVDSQEAHTLFFPHQNFVSDESR